MSDFLSAPKEHSVSQEFTADGVRAEMQQRVRRIAALSPEESRKAALSFTARVLNMPFDRVRRLFYGEARRVEAHEADQIRAYCHAAAKLIEARAAYETIRREYLATAHPSLADFVPAELPSLEDEARAQEAAASVAKTGGRQ